MAHTYTAHLTQITGSERKEGNYQRQNADKEERHIYEEMHKRPEQRENKIKTS